MNDSEMHETIRGLYQGIFEPDAWQRSLAALRDVSGSAHAALLVLDTEQDRVLVSQAAHPATNEAAAHDARPHRPDPGLPFAERLAVGDWYIDRRDAGEAGTRRPAYGEFFHDFELSSIMACLIDRRPTYEVYLSLQRPAGREGYSEADARALDWAIPHLREAIALRERTHAVAAHGHVSADLLNRLPFGVVVFSQLGKAMLTNPAGEPWVRRLVPVAGAGAADTPPLNGNGWRLSRPFVEVIRSVCDAATSQSVQAIQAIGTDGRSVQIVAMALTPALRLDADWHGQAVLVAIHEGVGTPRATTAVLRDLYGLTPAETRLAMLLTTGMGLPDACTQLGIKRETSRTQLKSVFTKTNTGTQAQLAHLLTRLGTVLTESARF